MIFRYVVKFYDGDKLIETIGLVNGDTYYIAVENVMKNFRGDEVESIYLEYLCDNGEILAYSDGNNYDDIHELLLQLKELKSY